jgi:ABC-type polysaccharide transport system permease subunit
MKLIGGTKTTIETDVQIHSSIVTRSFLAATNCIAKKIDKNKLISIAMSNMRADPCN